jgi:hypothetical protein
MAPAFTNGLWRQTFPIHTLQIQATREQSIRSWNSEETFAADLLRSLPPFRYEFVCYLGGPAILSWGYGTALEVVAALRTGDRDPRRIMVE